MLDMTTAYGVFANSGYRIDLHPILKVTDKKGDILEQYTPPQSPIFGKKVFPEADAFIISDILADNGARLQEFGPASALYFPGKYVSVKTGTTNDFRDNWTIGYTPNYVVTVWVGNNDNTRMNGLASGITGAAPIWHSIMAYLLGNKPVPHLPQPDSVVQKAVCSDTGLLPASSTAPSCPIKNEYFVKGSPNKVGTLANENIWIDKSTNRPPTPGQTDNLEMRNETTLTDPTGDKYCLTCPPPPDNPTPTPHP